jgi:hypothetical protein
LIGSVNVVVHRFGTRRTAPTFDAFAFVKREATLKVSSPPSRQAREAELFHVFEQVR